MSPFWKNRGQTTVFLGFIEYFIIHGLCLKDSFSPVPIYEHRDAAGILLNEFFQTTRVSFTS